MSNPHATGSSGDLFARILDRYNALPRAARWGVIAVTGFGGFLLLDSVLWPIADDLNRSADRMQSVLNRAADRAEGLPDDVVNAAVSHGPNSVPKLEKAGKDQLANAVAEIFKKRGINQGQDVRAQPLPQSVLPDIASALGGTMGKSVVEVRFEGTPDTVMAVLSEFDASPSIDAIGDLRMNYNPSTKRVGVQMTLEKWGVIQSTARGGA